MAAHDDIPRDPTEHDLRVLWNRTTLLLCVTSDESRFLAVNPAWTRVLGWRADQLIGRTPADFVHPDDIQHLSSAIPIRNANGELELIDFENRYRHADGSIRWLQWSTYQRGDRWIAVGRDVTAIHTAQQALQRSERRSRAMLTAMREGMLVVGPDRRVVEVSDRFADMVGWRPSELIGRQPPFPWWPPEETDRIHDMLSRALQGEFGSYQVVFRRRDGERFAALVENARLDTGEDAASVLAFARDISDLVDARRRLEEAHRVAGLVSWEWFEDGDRVVTAFNGLDPASPPGTEMSREASLQFIPPDDRAQITALLHEVTAGGPDGFTVEARLAAPGAEPQRIELRGRPVTAPDGTVTGVRGTTQDITARWGAAPSRGARG